MKILKLSPYCEPEQVSSSHLTNDLNEAFIEAGFTIENYVPTPSRGCREEDIKHYRQIKYETKNNGKLIIHRFSMFREGKNPIQRALRYFLINIIQFVKGINAKNVDVIFAGSTPPTQGLLCSLVKKRLKVPFVYNLQDIFPDSLVNAKMTKKGSFIWKIGRKIENFTYKSADKIIVINEGFKRNIVAKGVPEEKIIVISNWIDLQSVYPIDRKDNRIITEFGLDPTKFIVVYAGNMGETQGADIILSAAQKLAFNKDIQFVIFGSGACFSDVERMAETMDNVFIHPLLSQNRVSEVYSLGDVALITCKAGTGTAGMPSKTWSIMACNTPIIASFDVDSDLGDVIRESGAGSCVEPSDVNALVNAIQEAYSKRGILGNICLRNYVEKNASKSSCVKQYVDCIMSARNLHVFERS